MSIPEPVFLLTYENVAVSDELGRYVLGVEYTDHLTGKADEISVTLENGDGRWFEGWFPGKGDRLALKFGYAGQPLLDAGAFTIDEPEFTLSANVVTLHGLSAPATAPFRTKLDRGFDATDLRELVSRLATELELEVLGEVKPIKIDRVSQSGETTLAFLRRLAASYGYAFSIRPPRLVFYEIAKLESAKSALALRRTDLKPGARFKAQTRDTYVACEVTWLDPATKALRKVRVDAKFARQKIVLDDEVLRGVPTVPTRNLRVGVTGDDVRRWQAFLAERGHDPGPIDGIFGPLTRRGTISFQSAAGVARDGVAGPETFRVALEQGFGTTTPLEPGLRVEPAGAVLRREIRVESVEQAREQAQALLDAANRLRATGTIPIGGRAQLVAGANIDLSDVGRLSGKFSIQSSRHRCARRSGWETECEVTSV